VEVLHDLHSANTPTLSLDAIPWEKIKRIMDDWDENQQAIEQAQTCLSRELGLFRADQGIVT
jgi:hypothetical protein